MRGPAARSGFHLTSELTRFGQRTRGVPAEMSAIFLNRSHSPFDSSGFFFTREDPTMWRPSARTGALLLNSFVDGGQLLHLGDDLDAVVRDCRPSPGSVLPISQHGGVDAGSRHDGICPLCWRRNA